MEYLNWVADHPIFTFLVVWVVCCAFERKPIVKIDKCSCIKCKETIDE